MFSLLSPLTKYFKIKSVRIYDGVFILNSKVTFSILLACSVIISAKQYFGEPIRCIGDSKHPDFINNFCWTFGTYVLQYSSNESTGINRHHHYHLHQRNELVEIGIGPETKTSKRIYLRYYQWVVLILLLQALSFFLPSFLWKFWEGGRLQQLCNELDSVIVPDAWMKKRREMLVNYFLTNYKHIHTCYALKYGFCEVLNFIVCVLNIWLLNVFITGFWANYAPALSVITSYEWDIWNRITSRVFPKMSKCEFLDFGPSGSVQKRDALCLLPLNILNEKVFAFLWFWFIILIVISSLNIAFRVFLLLNSRFRSQLLYSQLKSIKPPEIHKILNKMSFGDWFLLHKISNNVNPIIFADLMQELSSIEKLKKDDDNSGIIV